MKRLLLIPTFGSLLTSCPHSATSPGSGDFNLKFSYGVNARNVLNTFDGTFTKDLVIDGTITVPFALTDSRIQRIGSKMSEVYFFDYPDTFSVPTGDRATMVTPHSTYIFHVVSNSTVKDLYWSDWIVSEDSSALKFRELITLIENIIESNPKYLQLPPARGGYL